MPMYRYSSLLLAALGLTAFNARAAALTELMSSVPPPPRDVATALTWVKDGQIVEPGYLRFKQAMAAEYAAVAALNGGALPAPGTAPPAGLQDAAEVQSAASAYAAYLTANSGDKDAVAALAKRTRWVQAATGMQLKRIKDQLAPCPDPCQDAAVAAKNQPLLAKKQRALADEMKMFGTLFPDWQRSRAAVIGTAEREIAATGDGAKATTPEGKAAVAQYRAAILKEIDALFAVTTLAVTRADAIENNRLVEPDGVSGATRKKKPAGE